MTEVLSARVTINGQEVKTPPEATSCVVYIAINRVNSHFYIGATQEGLRKRMVRHFWSAKHGKRNGHFSNAIRKYGADKFRFIPLIECSDIREAFEKEKKLIAELKPTYNMTAGGEGVIGYKYTKEQRLIMVESRKRKSGYKNVHKYRAIRCVTDNKEFPSMTFASKHYGISKPMLVRLCRKQSVSSSGLEFEYLSERRNGDV